MYPHRSFNGIEKGSPSPPSPFPEPSAPPQPSSSTSFVATGIPVVPNNSSSNDQQHDLHTCCLTCWCPCVAFGRIAEIVDRGSTSCGISGALYMMIMCVTGCSCLYSCFYRSKLRGQYFLKESPCTDCFVHCCCEGCSLCQEYRELKKHGFDIQKRLLKMAPTVESGMNR
ncbi:hypothetical protein MKW94_018751 [Papaver nudicaule]|uniref:Uncharacterized protein n=1 Tax=Papaver nudicaule TaxID=74823 RepID=A0AA42AXI8_PAPNU|nr:hypothetical protein [Papaver nudicaule]